MVRPDPIPNSAVKRRIADGSACIACARVGRRRFFFYISLMLSMPEEPKNSLGILLSIT